LAIGCPMTRAAWLPGRADRLSRPTVLKVPLRQPRLADGREHCAGRARSSFARPPRPSAAPAEPAEAAHRSSQSAATTSSATAASTPQLGRIHRPGQCQGVAADRDRRGQVGPAASLPHPSGVRLGRVGRTSLAKLVGTECRTDYCEPPESGSAPRMSPPPCHCSRWRPTWPCLSAPTASSPVAAANRRARGGSLLQRHHRVWGRWRSRSPVASGSTRRRYSPAAWRGWPTSAWIGASASSCARRGVGDLLRLRSAGVGEVGPCRRAGGVVGLG
jgi:hypothetical protein